MSRSYKKEDTCWEYRTGLEKILIAATVTAFVVVIALMIVVILLSKQDAIETNTFVAQPIYLKNKTDLEPKIDISVDPCENFYKFACGPLLNDANGDENLGPFYVIQEKAKRQIENVYNEPVKSNDHEIVKIAKSLYKKCMNESAIEKDGLKTIKNALRKLGGWPVVKGNNWDESKFRWIRAEYALRELGYFYSSFLTVDVVDDPNYQQKFIFAISMPDFVDFGVELFEKQRLMVDVAVAFGADEGRAILETAQLLEFMLEIKREVFLRRNDVPPKRIALSEIQKRFEFVNWIEFMNNIVGSSVHVSVNDYILFPSVDSLRKWYDFIEKTPKRTQANYMAWKVIEKEIPIIPALQKLTFKTDSAQKRSHFCIEQIRNRFTPSPIDLTYVRKRLPMETRSKIRKIIDDMRWELQNILEEVRWENFTEKYDAMRRVASLKVVVGAPEELLDDEALDDAIVDLKTAESSTFLELVAAVEKNHQSWFYNQIYTSKNDFRLTQWKLQTASAIGDYYYKDNTIILPATIFQDVVYDEKMPDYVNYGSVGTMMGHHFIHVIQETTIFDRDDNVIESDGFFTQNGNCLSQQINADAIRFMFPLILPKSLGMQLSYAAFLKQSSISDGDRNYTPNQLFWISSASYLCQPSNNYNDENDLFSMLVLVPMRNNAQFGRDFNCSLGSKMNPKSKCKIFT